MANELDGMGLDTDDLYLSLALTDEKSFSIIRLTLTPRFLGTASVSWLQPVNIGRRSVFEIKLTKFADKQVKKGERRDSYYPKRVFPALDTHPKL